VIDPVQVEVIGSALSSIADEMGETLVKASYSTNIKERRDCTTALFDARGRTLAQAEHIPIHLGSLMGIVDAVRDRYPDEAIRDGDTFIGNDPHTGGGTHLPDIVLVTPIFVDGAIAAWATNLAHHADFADRTHAHIYTEGLRIPAIRFARDWEINDEVFALILLNCQVPAERVADFRAQLAANRCGVRRYRELCDRYGQGVLDEAGAALLDYTERKIRAGIAAIPDGTYAATDVFDSDELDGELDVGLELTVDGEEMRLDFTAPPQVRASLNLVFTALQATVFYAVKTVVDPDAPANAGLHRPITVDAPYGSLLNASPPAAVNGRTQCCQRVVDLVHAALAQAVPDRVIAACNSAVTAATFSGDDPRTGAYYVYLETIGGGYGAGACFDGMDGVQVHITNTSNLPVESLEAEYPLLVEEYALVDDSGGPGRHRGGMGIQRRIRAEHDGCVCNTSTTRLRSKPWGLLGGWPGASARVTDGDGNPLPGTVRTLSDGQVVAVFTPGAGGYGDPRERAPEDVARDLREERISPQTAKEAYGVESDG